jgi:hypothetical protein
MNADTAYENLTLSLNILFEELSLIFRKKSKISKSDLEAMILDVELDCSALSKCLKKLGIETQIEYISSFVRSKQALRQQKQIKLIMEEIDRKLPAATKKPSVKQVFRSYIRFLNSCIA